MAEIQNNWKPFSEEYPEPYRNIKVNMHLEIVETQTYLFQNKLMLKMKDGNEFFQGMSPKLLDQRTQWTYC